MISYEEFQKIGKFIPNPYGVVEVKEDVSGAGSTHTFLYVNEPLALLCRKTEPELKGVSIFDALPFAREEFGELNYRAAVIGEEVSKAFVIGTAGESVLYNACPGDEEGICFVTITPFVESNNSESEKNHRLDHDLLATAINTVFPLCFFANISKNEFHMVDYGETVFSPTGDEGVYDELVEYTMESIPDQNEKEKFMEKFSRKSLGEAFERGESQIRLQHRQTDDLGAVHWVETNAVFVKNHQSEDILVMTLIKTIDKDKENEFLLKDALHQAEDANKAKSQFLSNMSHDIRTPMNAVIGFTSLAFKHVADPVKLKDCLNKINKSSEALLAIINDILDMSRIENEKMEVETQVCNINSLINDMWTLIQGEMDNKNLEFTVNTEGITEPWVVADNKKIDRILMNLLSNAVKFTPSGGKVSLTCTQDINVVNGFVSTEFRVKDNGIGMSEEFKEHVFEIFTRERSSTDSGVVGTGLGLAITKSMVEILGGTIKLESEKDKGTEFIITLPLKIDETKDEIEKGRVKDSSVPEGPAFKRLLLVEDNEMNREIAMELLLDEGFEVEAALNGQEAVELVENSEPGYYGAVLMDIQMPIMDGYEATKAIRNLKDRAIAKIPIIAMTANVFEEDRKLAMACGMDDHIPKPIDISKVKNSLMKIRMKVDRDELYTKRLFGKLKMDKKEQ